MPGVPLHRTLAALVALLTACGSPPGQEPPAVAAEGSVLENGSFTADLNGARIHYEVHGRGPVLMTLPNSWGLSLGGLRGMYRGLESRLTLVYFDPRGMGESGPVRSESDRSAAAIRDDFDALRRHLGLQRVDAIGWSNGATNLVLLASEKPETLASATFVHGTVRFGAEDLKRISEAHPDLAARFAAFQQEIGHEALTDAQREALHRAFTIDDYFPRLFADPEGGRGRMRELYADVELSWPHWVHAQEEFPGYDFTDRLAAIRAPSLAIAGAHDLIPPSAIEEQYRDLAGVRFEVFEKSGHFAPIEEPARFEVVLCDFLGAPP